MARVWFVRRHGGQWIAPGGVPAAELPLASLIWPLDLGTHRRVTDERPVPAPERPAEGPSRLAKVMVEVGPEDLLAVEFSGYETGVYDSPYSPDTVARRLAALRGVAAA